MSDGYVLLFFYIYICPLTCCSQAELEASGSFNKHDAIALATVNLEKLLGVHENHDDLVATMGGSLLDLSSKVTAIISPGRGLVDIL